MDPNNFRVLVNTSDDVTLARVAYCYQIGSAFVAMNLLEDQVIGLMLVCDKISLHPRKKYRFTSAAELIEKFHLLRGSTLGSLIKMLELSGVRSEDLNYLKWLRSKRDFFVHRFFHNGGWPGELSESECAYMMRTLRFLEIVFRRGTERIHLILARSNLISIANLESGGAVVHNDSLTRNE